MPEISSEFYKSLLDHLYDGVYFVNRQREITYWNEGAQRITGYTAQQVTGCRCSDGLLMHIDEHGTQLCKVGCPLAATIKDGKPREVEAYLHHADGHRVPVCIRVSPIQDSQGNITGAVEVFSDNTQMMTVRQQAERLTEETLHDALTGIGNRRYLEARISTALITQQMHRIPTGILMLDVDFFKRVNDVYGHDVGDDVLRMLATTLRRNVRMHDVVGRWGGEEFVAVFENVDSKVLLRIAEKLRQMVAGSQLQANGQTIQVTVSIGGTLLRAEDTLESALKRADTMLYASKQSGRNRVTIG